MPRRTPNEPNERPQNVNRAVERLFNLALDELSKAEQEDLGNALLANLWAERLEQERAAEAQQRAIAANKGRSSREGGGYFEDKLVYNTKKGKRYGPYGPYRYLRFRSRGSLRSLYRGKPPQSDRDEPPTDQPP